MNVGMAIAMLAEAYHVSKESLTPVRLRIYESALKTLPPGLLRPMVDRCIQTRRVYGKDALPAVPELLEDAEACRKLILDAHPFQACEACNRLGVVSVRRAGFQRPTYRPCECRTRWQQRMADLGAGTEPLALPAARSAEVE